MGGFSLEKIILRITIYSNIFIFMTVTNNIYQKQIKYHVFNAVTNSELTKLVPVFTIRPAFPTSVKKVNTSFKYVWRTWGPALPTLLADLMIFCPLGLTNFKNSDRSAKSCFPNQMCSLITNRKSIVLALLLFYRHRILFHFM